MGHIISERTYFDLVDADGHAFDFVGVSVEIPRGLARGAISIPSFIIRWSSEGCAFVCSAVYWMRGDMRFVARPQLRKCASADGAQKLGAA